MEVLTGILIDLSTSMMGNCLWPDSSPRSWSKSIVRVVDQLLKYDVSPRNKIFVLGYGAVRDPYVFDLLDLMRFIPLFTRNKSEMINDVLETLERNGAPFVREWANLKIETIEDGLSQEQAMFFLLMFNENPNNFTKKFVQKCLPKICKERSSSINASMAENRDCLKRIPLIGEMLYNRINRRVDIETERSISEILEKGQELIKKTAGTVTFLSKLCFCLKTPDPDLDFWRSLAKSPGVIVDLNRAWEILQKCADKVRPTDENTELKFLPEYIYGTTPMTEALDEARKLMSLRMYKEHKKVLFVLSDGGPTDGATPPDLSSLGVHVVSCCITSLLVKTKHLHSRKCGDLEKQAKYMFDLSSSLKTQLLPRTVFVKRGWTIDIENNETKLFLHVNKPELFDEVCEFARDVVCSQDALSDLLSSIDLDLYINKVNGGFGAKRQVGGTCYANASATVIHLATKRIVGRCGGYPEFYDLRDKLIAEYGGDGANTLKVLREVCPKYRLHCQEVDAKGALEAVVAKQPVIARFRLTDSEWDIFNTFYRTKPAGTLSKRDLDISKRRPRSKAGGHAVVLTGFNSKGLILMNSWGTDWANNGFFSVEDADVLGLKFVDVYWTLDDLKDSEIEAYKQEGPRISQKLISSLKGIQTAEYKCPLCHKSSLVREFRGKLVKATCPKCHDEFNTGREDAHDLVLNMYLTALSFSG